MKKIMTVLLVLLISDCIAATGNASDGPIVAIVVIGLILLIVGTGYFIDFMKNKLKEFRKKRLIKRNNFDHDGEFLNSFNKSISELDSISNL
jgi:hypothetical protein